MHVCKAYWYEAGEDMRRSVVRHSDEKPRQLGFP